MYTTRIAPSPTGDFHLGTARTAYFNWLAARSTGGRFILRIDDTDLSRNSEASVQVIFDCMDWLGLDYDDCFRQSDRMDHYKAIAMDLVTNGLAEVADNGAILLKNGRSTLFTDMISGVNHPTDFEQSNAAGQVLIKADGMPVYHFATVVDDHDYGVNLIIRGIDHHSNTFRHSAIYDALMDAPPVYAHLGLITQNGKKISKRDAAASLLNYRADGIRSDAMLNFLLRMGWGPTKDDKSMALIDKARAVDLFLSDGKMRNSPAGFDRQKLDSFNRKYAAIAEKMARVEAIPEPQ